MSNRLGEISSENIFYLGSTNWWRDWNIKTVEGWSCSQSDKSEECASDVIHRHFGMGIEYGEICCLPSQTQTYSYESRRGSKWSGIYKRSIERAECWCRRDSKNTNWNCCSWQNFVRWDLNQMQFPTHLRSNEARTSIPSKRTKRLRTRPNENKYQLLRQLSLAEHSGKSSPVPSMNPNQEFSNNCMISARSQR